MLKEFRIENCAPVGTSLVSAQKLVLAQEDDLWWDLEQYQYLTSKLIWIILDTQPDIAFVIGWLSQFNNDPTEAY